MLASHESCTLNIPINHQGRDYTEFQVRRPKAKDILRAVKNSGQPLEMDMEQLVHLCEVPRAVIDDLDISDLHGLQDILRQFVMPSEAKLREAMMTLSIHAGWDLATLENPTADEIGEWINTLDAIKPRG